MADHIPSPKDMATRVQQEVIVVRKRRAEQLALWCILEYQRIFDEEPQQFVNVMLPQGTHYDVENMVKKILEDKGWSASRGIDGGIYLSPGSQARYDAEQANPYVPDQALLDSIPSPKEAAEAVHRKVIIPRMRKAEEFALWCVQEFARKFEEAPDNHVIVSPPYPIHHDVWPRTEKILQERGWYISQWGNNSFYVSPGSSSRQGAQECARSGGSDVFF